MQIRIAKQKEQGCAVGTSVEIDSIRETVVQAMIETSGFCIMPLVGSDHMCEHTVVRIMLAPAQPYDLSQFVTQP